jgi:membrane fusion protein (multidrug efflux system)
MSLAHRTNTAPPGIVIWTLACLIISTLLTAAGCSTVTSAARPADPPSVEVAEVVQRDVPIYGEWIGTLDGMVNADIKAQVSGYLLEQDYTEGGFVRKGQLLFQIDPRPFKAVLDQAQGQVAQANGQLGQARAQLVQAEAQLAVAEANQGRTQLDVDRYVPLAKQQAITQQELDNATQNNLAAKAQIQAAKAAVETAKAQIQAANATVEATRATVETAQLNLGFTRLTSPIDGVAGIAQQQVGALVSPAGGPVTTVSTVDPIKAYFTLSEQEYLAFTRRFPSQASRDADRSRLQLELVLADGTTYPQKGRYYVADRQANQSTGAFRLAGLFPNPGNTLRPGQYGRVRAETATKKGALLVPQRAVSELQGSYQVAVVDPQNRVSIRTVKVGERAGANWIVEDGVLPGERVIAEGVQKAAPGTLVNPKPFPARAEATR